MSKILIVTGGSGGHVMPALSIFDHLKKNFDTKIVTDKRGSKFIDNTEYKFNVIDVPNLNRKLYLLPLNLTKFLLSIIRSYFFLKKERINFLISTGGYMSLPACIASKMIGLKIYLIEPNSVLGRTNSFILSLCSKIICYDKDIKNFPNKYSDKMHLISPILRKEVYKSLKNEKNEFTNLKKILVVGGSQGAKFFDKNITELILKISKKIQIEICQQIYDDKEKIEIKKKYNDAKIKNTLFKFDEKLYQKISQFDLVITRSGASAIAEFVYFKIPFIAIPFPFAKDDHQYYNAKYYENLDCCWLIRQNKFEINFIADLITNLFNDGYEYINKKKKIETISNKNTWENINKALLEIINEN